MQLAQHGAAPDRAHSLTRKETHSKVHIDQYMRTPYFRYRDICSPTVPRHKSTYTHKVWLMHSHFRHAHTCTHSRNICCSVCTNPHSCTHSNKQLKTQITAYHTRTHIHTHSLKCKPTHIVLFQTYARACWRAQEHSAEIPLWMHKKEKNREKQGSREKSNWTASPFVAQRIDM